MTILKTVLFFTLLFPPFSVPILHASPGDTDNTFGSSGSALGSHLLNPYYAVAIQDDGKIVAAGGDSAFIISRYTSSGVLDTSFSTDGKDGGIFGAGEAGGRDIVIQPDGKILVLARNTGGSNNVAAARYNSDGTLDASFGNDSSPGDGIVIYDVDTALGLFSTSADTPEAMALQSDGKILITGYTKDSTKDQLFVMRLNTDGSLDTTFRSTGVKVYTFGQQSIQYGHAMALSPDGKIVIVGRSWVDGASDKEDTLVAVFNADGTLDSTFSGSGSGWTLSNTANWERLTDVEVQTDGKIIATGFAGAAQTTTDFLAVRYNIDGSLDTTFHTDGIFTKDSATFDRAWASALQPDGKFLFSGWAVNNETTRLLSDGNPDTSFGVANGTNSIASFYARALAMQTDGKIILVGSTATGDTAIYRLEGDSFDSSPDDFSFSDISNVTVSSLVTSNLVTITGLSAGIKVPVTINNGEFAINGSTSYQTSVGFVSNNDQVNVRHTSAASAATTVNTVLNVGGVFIANRQVAVSPNSDTFSSTTGAGSGTSAPVTTPITTPPPSSGGSSSMSVYYLYILCLLAFSVRRKHQHGCR